MEVKESTPCPHCGDPLEGVATFEGLCEPCDNALCDASKEMYALCLKYAETLAFTGLFPADLARVRDIIAKVNRKRWTPISQ